jgi:hypothetical protein
MTMRTFWMGASVAAIFIATGTGAWLFLTAEEEKAQARIEHIRMCSTYCAEISPGILCDDTLDSVRGRVFVEADGSDTCLCYIRHTNYTPWELEDLKED